MSRTRSTSRSRSRAGGDRVLVLSNRDDVHAWAVLRRLEAIGGPADAGVLFDTATFPMASDLAVRSAGATVLSVYPALPEMYGQGTRAVLREAGPGATTEVPMDRVRSVYWRRPRPSIIDDALSHPDLRQYAAKSSRETLEGLIEQLALERPVMDPPGAVARASHKLLQLELARQLGLQVPRSLVTNSARSATEFVEGLWADGSEVISKSPADLHYFPAQTELVDRRKMGQLHQIRLSPTILQERIVGGPDLRITVVGERLFAMSQTTAGDADPVDSRLEPTPHRGPWNPPTALRRQILALQRRLGLRFGAYDFKCDAAGTPYFLEVNPSGQWLFAEIGAGLPIAEAIARHLWNGPGGEWETSLPPLRDEELASLFPFSMEDEYADVWRTLQGDAALVPAHDRRA